MSKLSDTLEKLVDNIDTVATDLSTLDVVTLSGKISAVIVNGKFIKPAKIVEKAETSADIKIEAFTHIDFDQDLTQFYKDGLTENDLTYKLHQQAVESSKTARMAMLNFIKEVAGR
jgi:hypothetical protein